MTDLVDIILMICLTFRGSDSTYIMGVWHDCIHHTDPNNVRLVPQISGCMSSLRTQRNIRPVELPIILKCRTSISVMKPGQVEKHFSLRRHFQIGLSDIDSIHFSL